MKKSFLIPLSLLSSLAFLASCNEKISPELENAGSTDSSTTIETPTTYYFRVTNSNETYLNYHLHRTGPSNSYKKCEISKTTAFTSTLYAAESGNAFDDKVYDIACFFEAEELALYFSGLKFDFEASKNTCDYIGYGPYSYYKYMPGSSTRTVVGKSRTDATAGCAAEAPVTVTSSGNLGCGDIGESFYADTSVAAGSRVILDDDSLCTFDYSDSGGPNCDPGVITVNQYTYSWNTQTLTTDVVASERTVNCGGKISNCISGPITQETQLTDSTSGVVLYQTTLNGNFGKSITLPAPILDQNRSNISIVNFRRDLANANIDYGDTSLVYSGSSTTNYALGGSFNVNDFASGQTYAKRFNPILVQRYSTGLDGSGNDDGELDYTDNVTPSAAYTALTSRGYRARPYASDPFQGTVNGYRTSPAYAFYCFDRAFEVKARIRMYVRDWDRVFYSDASQTQDFFALISDIDQVGSNDSRIHNPSGLETTSDNTNYNVMNDILGWEDIIYMNRDDSGGSAIFRPSSGYFDQSMFPGY